MQINLPLKISLVLVTVLCLTCSHPDNYTKIIIPQNANTREILAGKEVRRYIYQRTGKLLSLINSDSLLTSEDDIILVVQKDSPIISQLNNNNLTKNLAKLADQEFILKTIAHNNNEITILCGWDAQGTLYAAYQLAEHLGVRFYLHGDVLPDKKIPLTLELDEIKKPLFTIRGIQPFHDFPEGPDWWSSDDFKAILSQLPKLKMNFIGLHTYPEGGVGPEPTVWIGDEDDLSSNGDVKFSYPARHFTTLNGTWGYRAKKTHEYYFGMDELFEKDAYGADYMDGMTPWPDNKQACNTLFNRTGNFFSEVFTYGKLLGIKTCVGTETPLIIPKNVQDRLKNVGKNPQKLETTQALYQGMFQWIKKNYPIDYYWFWTPENWTWGGNRPEDIRKTKHDIEAAITAANKVEAPFKLATCGWVLGPKIDRALFDRFLPKDMVMSCINRRVGFAPVDLSFARIKNRPKWAIPWLEDDPAMIIPQLWAGRMRRDAADALAYGCTGLIGIHWRTRILGPNVSALAKAAWEQQGWNPSFGKAYEAPNFERIEGSQGALFTTFSDTTINDLNDESIFRTLIFSMDNYYLNLENGNYDVTLKFLEVHYKQKGRRLFGIKIQTQTVLDTLDIFDRVGYGQPLNLTFENITISNNRLHLFFERFSDNPILAGIVVSKHSDDKSEKQIVRKINCAGKLYNDFEADPSLALQGYEKPRDLPVEDFYKDWALTHFGADVASDIAKLFTRLDGNSTVEDVGGRKANLPRPSNWRRGPGGIFADPRTWDEVSKDYKFIAELELLRPKVEGKGSLERFDYWLNNFKYLKAMGKFNCTLHQYDLAMEQVRNEKNPTIQRKKAREIALPLRIQQMKELKEIHKYLQATIKTTGSMGVIVNWQQHNIPTHIEDPGKELARILGEDLPKDALPSKEYPGQVQLIVPTVCTCLLSDEPLRLKVILLGDNAKKATLYWKSLASQKYQDIALTPIAGGVFKVTLGPEYITNDFEYYVQVESEKNGTLVFPATAPEMNQTVVVIK